MVSCRPTPTLWRGSLTTIARLHATSSYNAHVHMRASRIRASLQGCLWAKTLFSFQTEAQALHVMTTAYTSLGLRKRPFSFSEGLSTVFDHAPMSGSYHISATPQIADTHAIASDFIATGNDMRVALS